MKNINGTELNQDDTENEGFNAALVAAFFMEHLLVSSNYDLLVQIIISGEAVVGWQYSTEP